MYSSHFGNLTRLLYLTQSRRICNLDDHKKLHWGLEFRLSVNGKHIYHEPCNSSSVLMSEFRSFDSNTFGRQIINFGIRLDGSLALLCSKIHVASQVIHIRRAPVGMDEYFVAKINACRTFMKLVPSLAQDTHNENKRHTKRT